MAPRGSTPDPRDAWSGRGAGEVAGHGLRDRLAGVRLVVGERGRRVHLEADRLAVLGDAQIDPAEPQPERPRERDAALLESLRQPGRLQPRRGTAGRARIAV